MKTDFGLVNHGSIFLLTPKTKRAKAWVDNFLPPDVQTLGNGIAVEPRYVDDIVDGIMSDSLTVG